MAALRTDAHTRAAAVAEDGIQVALALGSGPNGASSPNGFNGRNGSTGSNDSNGSNSPNCPSGPSGPSGSNGSTGANGITSASVAALEAAISIAESVPTASMLPAVESLLASLANARRVAAYWALRVRQPDHTQWTCAEAVVAFTAVAHASGLPADSIHAVIAYFKAELPDGSFLADVATNDSHLRPVIAIDMRRMRVANIIGEMCSVPQTGARTATVPHHAQPAHEFQHQLSLLHQQVQLQQQHMQQMQEQLQQQQRLIAEHAATIAALLASPAHAGAVSPAGSGGKHSQ
jgi:hypothetical protein